MGQGGKQNDRTMYCRISTSTMKTRRNTMNRGLHAYFTLFAGILLGLLASGQGCNVEIAKPYHPMYVQTGKRLELVCTARNCKPGERVRLQWWRQTGDTSWGKAKNRSPGKHDPLVSGSMWQIVPELGGRWVTRDLYEEPSGNVASTLVLSDIAVSDHGWYICRDEQDINTYTIWVSTLQVDASPNVTLSKEADTDVTLGCTVSGPQANLPRIEYEWTWSDLRIINVSDRFTLHPPDVGTQRLVIHKPKRRDGGKYTCSFIFGTNLGPVIFSKTIYVDTSQLPSSPSQRAFLYPLLLGLVFLVTGFNLQL